ncbi:MAG: NfeD family protein [Actinomycetes bacterium]
MSSLPAPTPSSRVPAGRHLRPAAARALLLLLAVATMLGLVAGGAAAQQDGDGDEPGVTVDVLQVEGFLDPPVARAITDVIVQANERGSSLVVIQLDAPGAVSVDIDELVATVRESAVPVAVFVGPVLALPEAGGGAALLFGAAHVRAVSPTARLGPVAPLDLADDPDATREEARAALVDAWPELADAPDLADALLDGTDRLDALEDAGAVDLQVFELEPLLVELDGRTVTTAAGETELRIRRDEVDVRFFTLGLVRRLLHAATTPAFIYLLLVVGLGMLLFEVFQPGFGVAGLAGLITAGIGAFGLTVLPVAWWAVALVVLGLLLYAVDTAIAGFGPVTLAATVAFVIGSLNFYDSAVVGLDGWLVGLTTVTALGFFVVVMTVVLRAQAGPDDAAVEDLIGRPGIVRSVLNPEGHVYIDEALWRARWTGEGKRAKVGTPVKVHGVDGPVVLVDVFDPEAEKAARATTGDTDPDEAGA